MTCIAALKKGASMVDTVQHPITTTPIPLIPASNQTFRESKRQDKKRFGGRQAKDPVTKSGEESFKKTVQPILKEDSSTCSPIPERKKIDIIV
jgi:hypothetical protein